MSLLKRLISVVAPIAGRIPFTRRQASEYFIDKSGNATSPRPRPFSMAADYTSWESLTDRRFTGRHLPPPKAADQPARPAVEEVLKLFSRQGAGRQATDTSVLFSAFAQWFTDSFLRTDRSMKKDSFRKNTSNHEIDLCEIYGLDAYRTRMLRSMKGGRLRSQRLKDSNGAEGEFPEFLYEKVGGQLVVRKEFRGAGSPEFVRDCVDGKQVIRTVLRDSTCGDALSEPAKERAALSSFLQSALSGDLHDEGLLDRVFAVNTPGLSEEEKKAQSDALKANAFAVGLEHGNSSIGNSVLNTLFLREHNRIAGELAKANPDWLTAPDGGDERLFQTARNVLTVLLLKLVVEEYIVHISPIEFPLEMVPFVAEGKKWNKSNWIAIEFSLLYRWHSLVPDVISDGTRTLGPGEFINNNSLVIAEGIDSLLGLLARAPAGRIGLKNTPVFLEKVEVNTLKLMREADLASFNAYRVQFGLDPLTSFAQLSDDPALVKELTRLYGTIDKLEWYVGIFAERYDAKSMMGELLLNMVAYDAFTQALTNPLLARNVYGKDTFSEEGLKIIENTHTLQDLVNRNCPKPPKVSFEFPKARAG
ncbi:peroxidase family protein [Nevskia sp.]|uniref:peroxidase family protein n=1 Tax=Nevskia sp. TaxID=1929292 RepID=UPI0025E9E4BD|nr:peroxidase family protein [Nevskia sp.]